MKKNINIPYISKQYFCELICIIAIQSELGILSFCVNTEKRFSIKWKNVPHKIQEKVSINMPSSTCSEKIQFEPQHRYYYYDQFDFVDTSNDVSHKLVSNYYQGKPLMRCLQHFQYLWILEFTYTLNHAIVESLLNGLRKQSYVYYSTNLEKNIVKEISQIIH